MSDREVLEILATRRKAAQGNAAEVHLIDEVVEKINAYVSLKKAYDILCKTANHAAEEIELTMIKLLADSK